MCVYIYTYIYMYMHINYICIYEFSLSGCFRCSTAYLNFQETIIFFVFQ